MFIMDEQDDQDPLYQSIQIQRQRILKIIDQMLEKIQLVMCLEDLAETEPKLLCNLLISPEQLKILLEEAGRRSTKRSRMRQTETPNVTATDSFYEKREMTHMHLNVLIATLHQTPKVMEKVASLIVHQPILHSEFLIRVFEFREYIKDMINETALEEKAYCKQISNSWNKNKNYKNRNRVLRNNFELKKEKLSEKIQQKNDLKEIYIKNINDMHEKSKYEIQEIIRISETRMKKAYIKSEEDQLLLSQEAKQITQEYQLILENDLHYEKQLRVKRFKVETVLSSWITKYDTDIGELQAQLEIQKDGFDSEKASYDALNARFKEQTVQYDVLMQEKKEEEERLWNIKYYAFLRQRGCRVIQRWWRRIYHKKFKKKKGKGKKGKKK